MKLVINKRYGGFGLSDAAYEKLIEWGVPTRAYIESERGEDGLCHEEPANDGEVIFDNNLASPGGRVTSDRYWECWTGAKENRSHPLVVRVVEELGEAANGSLARLRVVEIPDGTEWVLDEYDGIETVHETHKSWG